MAEVQNSASRKVSVLEKTAIITITSLVLQTGVLELKVGKAHRQEAAAWLQGSAPDVISPCLWRRGLDEVPQRSHKSNKDSGGAGPKSPRNIDKSVPKVPLPIASSGGPSGAHAFMLRLLTLGKFFNNTFPTYPCVLPKKLCFSDCRGVKVPGPTLRGPSAHCEFFQHRNDAKGPPLKDVGKCGASSRTVVIDEIMQNMCSSEFRYYYYWLPLLLLLVLIF